MSQRVTQAEFARIAGVNRSTVTRWIRNGRITAGKDGRIDVDRALRERETTESPMPHHQARKAQFDERKAAAPAGNGNGTGSGTGAPAPPTADSPIGDISAALKLETYRLQKAKAEKAALEADRLAGSLVEYADVEFVLDDLGQVLRALLESQADRLAGTLAGHRGDTNAIHATLEEAAHELLTEISGHMARRMERLTTGGLADA